MSSGHLFRSDATTGLSGNGRANKRRNSAVVFARQSSIDLPGVDGVVVSLSSQGINFASRGLLACDKVAFSSWSRAVFGIAGNN